jgi:zinc transport system substrate-binding protein
MKRILYLLFMALFISACSKQGNEALSAEGKPVVYVVNYPLAYFAERIAGDTIDIVFPEMEGDPAFWNPTPEEIGKYQNAGRILLNGASYAKWVSRVSLPQSKLIDTSSAFKERLIEIDGSVTHTHGPGGAHAHGDLAFTTWLDPQLAI